MAGSVIALLGPTGAGKTEQAYRLAQRRGWAHLSSGRLLREDNNPQIREEMNQGKLADSGYVDNLLAGALEKVPMEEPIVLDGFLRTPEDVDWLNGELTRLGRRLDKVIFLRLSQEESRERLLKRGRPDDTAAAIDEKWQEYHRVTEPLLEHYHQSGLLQEIDGHGSREEIESRIDEALGEK